MRSSPAAVPASARAIALALAGVGVDVTICGRRGRRWTTSPTRAAGFIPVVADVTDEASVAALYGQAEAARGPFDIVVANAGTAQARRRREDLARRWQRMLDVNLTGPSSPSGRRSPGWRERGRGASCSSPRRPASRASPMSRLRRGQARGRRPDAGARRGDARTGVTVNAVCPGFIETAMLGGSIDTIVAKTGRGAERPGRAWSRRTRGPLRRTRRGRGGRASGSVGEDAARSPGRRSPFREAEHGERAACARLGRATAKQRLRLWLRLLRASRAIEAALRERLEREFDTTLPQFDVLAALSRQHAGMTMTELSRLCSCRTATSPASSTGWPPTGWSPAPAATETAAPAWCGSPTRGVERLRRDGHGPRSLGRRAARRRQRRRYATPGRHAEDASAATGRTRE